MAAFQHMVEEAVLISFQGSASTQFLTSYLSFALLSGGFVFFSLSSSMLAVFLFSSFSARGSGATEQHRSLDESRSVWKVLHEVLLLAMFLHPARSLIAAPKKT